MNPKLGDVGFKVGAKSYVLNMGVNALCLVEEETKAPSTQVLEQVLDSVNSGALRIRELRVLFWAGLQRHHPEIDRDAAGDLMQAMGRSKDKTLDVIIESMKRCSPDVQPSDVQPSDGEAGEASADPRPAPAHDGTGTLSS